MKKYFLLTITLMALYVPLTYAGDPPMSPPKGYSWANCPEIKGAFLQPTGWHFKRGRQGDTLGFFISREKIEDKGQFVTGLTVNVIFKVPEKKSMSPYDFARQFRESARESSVFSKEWDKDMGPFKSVGFVYSRNDTGGSFTAHNLLIANNKTGTLYLVIFEAPSAEWSDAWKIAEPMLQYLYIDDTI